MPSRRWLIRLADSLLTNLINRLPSVTAVTARQKPAVRGRGSAVADELSAAAAKLSAPAAPEAAAASQLPPTSTAAALVTEVPPTRTPTEASPRDTLSVVPAAAAQPACAGGGSLPLWPPA